MFSIDQLFCIVLAHSNSSQLDVDIYIQLYIISWIWNNHNFAITLYYCVLRGTKRQILQCLVEPTIFSTPGEKYSYYITATIPLYVCDLYMPRTYMYSNSMHVWFLNYEGSDISRFKTVRPRFQARKKKKNDMLQINSHFIVHSDSTMAFRVVHIYFLL